MAWPRQGLQAGVGAADGVADIAAHRPKHRLFQPVNRYAVPGWVHRPRGLPNPLVPGCTVAEFTVAQAAEKSLARSLWLFFDN